MYILSSSPFGLVIRVIFDLFACIENMKLESILCREKIKKMISLIEFVLTLADGIVLLLFSACKLVESSIFRVSLHIKLSLSTIHLCSKLRQG